MWALSVSFFNRESASVGKGGGKKKEKRNTFSTQIGERAAHEKKYQRKEKGRCASTSGFKNLERKK